MTQIQVHSQILEILFVGLMGIVIYLKFGLLFKDCLPKTFNLETPGVIIDFQDLQKSTANDYRPVKGTKTMKDAGQNISIENRRKTYFSLRKCLRTAIILKIIFTLNQRSPFYRLLIKIKIHLLINSWTSKVFRQIYFLKSKSRHKNGIITLN